MRAVRGRVSYGRISAVVKMMGKVITLLELFASGEVYSFSEVAVRTGLTRSNASHLLSSLCGENVLEKTGYGRYRRGERLTRLCMSSNPWEALIEKASRCADNLVQWMNELAVVGMRDEDRRLTLVKRRPEKNLQVEPEGGKSYPADWYGTANGRILLAYAPGEILRRVVRRCGLPDRKIWRGAETLPKLERELEQIRGQGYVAVRVDEVIRAVGVPVRDASGEAVLSLSTAFPVFCCRREDREIVDRMRSLASVLEEELAVGGIRVADLKQKSAQARTKIQK